MNRQEPSTEPVNVCFQGLLRSCALLTFALLVFFPLVGAFAYGFRDLDGVMSAAVAMMVCLFAGVISEIAVRLFNDPTQVMYRVLFGMLLRMGIPLGFCMAVHSLGGRLADAGFVYYLLVFYMVTLVVDTLLTLRVMSRDARPAKDG